MKPDAIALPDIASIVLPANISDLDMRFIEPFPPGEPRHEGDALPAFRDGP
jgi:hypothetical protein